MTKKQIIALIIIVTFATLNVVLFGCVFRLRKIEIKVANNIEIAVQESDIIESANLTKGISIFLIDKDEVVSNIEKTFAEIKVLQIKTVSLTKVQIIVRAREEVFYAQSGNFHYCLDEDLKVLRKVEIKPSSLVEIDANLNITSNTETKDFVGTLAQQKTISGLYRAIVTSVKVENDGEMRYAEREDLRNILQQISFGYKDNINERYDVLTLKTCQGVTIEIGKPNEDIVRKINICFSALQSDEYKNKKDGVIRIYYDNNNNELIEYFAV